MKDFNQLADTNTLNTTKAALERNNISVFILESNKEAYEKVLSLIPPASEVMTATSTTLDQLGLTSVINDSGKYNSIKEQLKKLDRNKDSSQMQKLGAAPDYVIGSVHAVTQDGKVVVASGSGSQLPSYTYGAQHVIWVVSTKKIVEDLDAALDRIYKHVLPQEDKRMKNVYGPESGSSVNKLFILQKELNPKRVTIIFIKEDLGF